MTIGRLSSVNGYGTYGLRKLNNGQRYVSKYANNTIKANESQKANGYVSEEGNSCTDGKDDGKIGFFSAIGNIFEGAVKGVVNGVKGMFTNDKGEFDLFKTIGTVVMGAACIACPAIGLAACAVGAVTGGAKLVGGVVKACNAKTDAEAKDAWEEVGNGGTTLGVSILGAKASYGAIKSNGAGALNSLKSSSEFQNATKLGKIGQTIKAFGKDAWSSTKNGLGKLKNMAGTVQEALRIKKLKKLTSKIEGAPTTEELSMIEELKYRTDSFGNQDAIKIADKLESISKGKSNLKEAKLNLKDAKNLLKEVKQNKEGEEAIKAAQELVSEAQEAVNAVKSNTGFGKLTTKLKNTNTVKYLSKNGTKLTEGGIKNLIKNIKANKDSLEISKILSNLSSDGKAIATFLTQEKGTYAQAVQKYGYDNVLQVLETLAGYRLTDETV